MYTVECLTLWIWGCLSLFILLSIHSLIHPQNIHQESAICPTLCLIQEMPSWKLFRCCFWRGHSSFVQWVNVTETFTHLLPEQVLEMQRNDRQEFVPISIVCFVYKIQKKRDEYPLGSAQWHIDYFWCIHINRQKNRQLQYSEICAT